MTVAVRNTSVNSVRSCRIEEAGTSFRSAMMTFMLRARPMDATRFPG